MVNNKGWIRIVEASIAVLIVFSVLLVVSRTNNSPSPVDLTSTITPILDEVARNVTLREEIIKQPKASSTLADLDAFVEKRIKQSTIKHSEVICEVQEICSLVSYPKDAANIYAGERVISSTLNSFNPKKVKIFLWRV